MKARRVLRGTLIGIGSLLLLIVLLISFGLSSNTVAKKAIALALGKTFLGLEVGEIRGRLRGPLILLHIKYSSGALHAEVDSALIDWRPTRLLLGRVEFRRLHVTGVHITLPDSTPPDTTAKARRQRPVAPFLVLLGDAFIHDLEVTAPGKTTFRAGQVKLAGSLSNYGFDLTGNGFTPRVGAGRIHLNGHGTPEGIALDRSTADLLEGELVATGKIRWWPRLEWDLTLAADSISPAPFFPHPAKWPGRVSLRATTSGAIDSSGPVGKATIDSVGGTLRKQPLGGHARIGFAPGAYDLPVLDLTWGSAHLAAQGSVHDTVAVSYDLTVADLRTVAPRSRGSVQTHGSASGPVKAPRIRASLESWNLASGTNRLGHARATADVDLAHNGRNEVELRGEKAQVGTTVINRVVATLHGTHPDHRLAIDAVGPTDSLHLGMNGGQFGRSWRGRVSALQLATARLGGWRLEKPAALALSTTSARLQTLCLAADSANGRLCAEGTWRGGRNGNVLATVEGLPLMRLPLAGLDSMLGRRGKVTGTLGARLEAHAAGGRIDGSFRAASDTVGFTYKKHGDEAEHRLALDSAIVDVHADLTGLRTTVTVRMSEQQKEVLTLAGETTLPNYRIGGGLAHQPMVLKLSGKIPDLAYAQAFVSGIDSLKGSVALDVTGSGTASAPLIDGKLLLGTLVVGLPGRRAFGGNFELAGNGGLAPDGSLKGELKLTPSAVHWDYRYFAEQRRVSLDSGTVVLKAASDGITGNVGLGASDAKGKAIASLGAELRLPEYTRLGMHLRPQPIGVRIALNIPDLSVTQPLMITLDSIGGKMTLETAIEGHLGSPIITGKFLIEDGRGRLEYGTMVRGGLAGVLDAAVTSDSTILGTLKLQPRGVTFAYPVGAGIGLTRLDNTEVDIKAGADGVHGTVDLTFADTTGRALGTIRARAALPHFTRLSQHLAAQPVAATLEGRVADLSFLEAFTSQVDSAAGRANLDASLDGTLGDSHLVGAVELKDVAARMPVLGLLLEDIQFTGKGDQAGSITINGKLRSGGGELTLAGTTPVQSSSAHPGHLQLRGSRFEALNNGQLHAVLSPRLDVKLAGDSIDIRGEVDVPLARLMLTQLPVVAVAPSDDVILVDSVLVRKRPVTVQVRITLGDTVSFSGFNFDAQLGGSMLLMQQSQELPTASGILFIQEGHYKAYGQDLTIRNGEVRFAGGPVDNPALAITATRTSMPLTTMGDSVVAGIRILGTVKEPQVTLFSEPTMSETQILSYLLTGGPVDGGAAEGNFVDKALSSLGLKGGNLVAASVGHHVGLDEARLTTESDIRGTSLTIGRFLSPSLYLSYGIGLFDPISTLRLRYMLSNHFTLLAETGRASSADALIKVEPGKSKTP